MGGGWGGRTGGTAGRGDTARWGLRVRRFRTGEGWEGRRGGVGAGEVAPSGGAGAMTQEACTEVAKPEWWNDEELKALSARVVRAAPNELGAN